MKLDSKRLEAIKDVLKHLIEKEERQPWLKKKLFGNRKRQTALANIIVAMNNLMDYDLNNQNEALETLKSSLSQYALLTAHSHYSDEKLRQTLDELFFLLTYSEEKNDVLTVLSPGTMISSDRIKVASTEAVKQFKNVILLDGVGILGKKSEKDQALHPIPGLFNPKSFTKTPKSWLSNNWLVRNIASLLGILRGTGEDNNINYVMHLLEKLKSVGKLPKVINLVGFSRGDTQNLKLAHKIGKQYPNISINMIGEPVAGPGRKRSIRKTNLPRNVRVKITFLSLHASNYIKYLTNEPQDATRLKILDESKTKLLFLTTPGTHKEQDVAEFSKEASPTYEHNYRLMTEFLLANGSEPKNKALSLSSDYKHCDLFMKLLFEKKENQTQSLQATDSKNIPKNQPQSIQATGSKNISKNQPRFIQTTVSKNIHQYVKRPDYFIHELHAKLFEHLFPTTYRVFFQNNLYLATDRDEIAEEMKIMAIESPITYGFLIKELQTKEIITGKDNPIEEIKKKKDGFWCLFDTKELHRAVKNLTPAAKSSFNFFYIQDKDKGKVNREGYMQNILRS